MKTSIQLSTLLVVLLSTSGLADLQCAEVTCPENSYSCNMKYHTQPKPRVKITTVYCYDERKHLTLEKTYQGPVDELEVPLPTVSCGELTCKAGAYNCSSITVPNIKVDPPMETTYLTCRDIDGEVIEEKSEVKKLSSSDLPSVKPPSCANYECPKGSMSCDYKSVITLNPYKETNHIKCRDIRGKVTMDITI